ncbi:hypothetical protein [Rhizobium herbae]|nr:hypothetical protein [Rhizobium herbae]
MQVASNMDGWKNPLFFDGISTNTKEGSDVYSVKALQLTSSTAGNTKFQ